MNKKRYARALACAMSLCLLGGCGTVTSVDPSENAAVKVTIHVQKQRRSFLAE